MNTNNAEIRVKRVLAQITGVPVEYLSNEDKLSIFGPHYSLVVSLQLNVPCKTSTTIAELVQAVAAKEKA